MEVTETAKLAHVAELTVAQTLHPLLMRHLCRWKQTDGVSDGAGRADAADRSDRADGATDAPPTAGAAACVGGSRD